MSLCPANQEWLALADCFRVKSDSQPVSQSASNITHLLCLRRHCLLLLLFLLLLLPVPMTQLSSQPLHHTTLYPSLLLSTAPPLQPAPPLNEAYCAASILLLLPRPPWPSVFSKGVHAALFVLLSIMKTVLDPESCWFGTIWSKPEHESIKAEIEIQVTSCLYSIG